MKIQRKGTEIQSAQRMRGKISLCVLCVSVPDVMTRWFVAGEQPVPLGAYRIILEGSECYSENVETARGLAV